LIDRGDEPINWDPNATGPVNKINEPNINNETADIIVGAATMIPDAVINKRAAGVDDPVPVPLGPLWMFTDGGSSANGKANCKASYAYYITDGETVADESGIVPEAEISGKQFKSSNNRGELMAILRGLQFIRDNSKQFKFDSIIVVSDSQYSIGCITIWAENWFSNPTKYKLSEKKNLDLITPAKEAYDSIRDEYRITFHHVNSHKKAPLDTSSQEWFIWKCNDYVDKLCGKVLR
jgi:ribonuclease HI